MTGAARRAGCSIRCGGGALWGRSTKVAGASAPEYPKCSYLLARSLQAASVVESNRIESKRGCRCSQPTNHMHSLIHAINTTRTARAGAAASAASNALPSRTAAGGAAPQPPRS